MSSTSAVLLCIVAITALAYTEGRMLQQVQCSPELCEAASDTNPEIIRPFVTASNRFLCDCTCDNDENTLLHLSGSTEGGCIVCTDLLANPPLTCPIDVRNKGGNTPLHRSAEICQIPMTDLFLRFGADPNAMNNNGDTPICLAVMNGIERCASVIQSIIQKGGDPCKPCSNGDIPFNIATNSVVKDIIANGGGSTCP